jgi:hypothetical protein
MQCLGLFDGVDEDNDESDEEEMGKVDEERQIN